MLFNKKQINMKKNYFLLAICLLLVLGACKKKSSDPNNQTSISNGLIAYYPFSGNVNDASGNSYNLTNSGATLTDDKSGNPSSAYKFSSISDKLTVSSANLTPQNFTISLWFKVLTSWSYTTLNLFSISRDSDSQSGGFSIRLDQNNIYGTGKYKFYAILNTASIIPAAAYPFSDINKWNHLVFIKNGSTVNLYLNNTIIGSGDFPESIDFTSTLLQIGNKRNLNSNNLGERVIDEVRVYNRALTSSEISYLYSH